MLKGARLSFSKDTSGMRRLPVWTFGINDHLEIPNELPPGFQPSGMLLSDFRRLCEEVGCAPHPAIKVKPKAPVQHTREPRRPSTIGPNFVIRSDIASPVVPTQSAEGPELQCRTVLFDRASVQLLSILLPTTTNIKALIFSDCRLDTEMMRILRSGLTGSCSVESLQVEWNAMELPLSGSESDFLAPLSTVPPDDEVFPSGASAPDGSDVGRDEVVGGLGPGGGSSSADAAGRNLEACERRRYLMQSQRVLRCFRETLAFHRDGNLEAVWQSLDKAKVDFDAALSSGEFYEVVGGHFGLGGPQVNEVFETLDGPDYSGCQGTTTLNMLRSALEGLPDEASGVEATDPIGQTLAGFLDGDCVLESLSLRSCNLSRLEMGPISSMLSGVKPWQLRCLNFWDNRVCDRGAELLATALETYRGLEYLGLGRNRISEVGLKMLCKPFEPVVLDEEQSKKAAAAIKEQVAKNEAMAKAKAQEAPSKERRRRAPLPQHNELEERPAGGDGDGPTWLLRRPSELRSLVLSENPIRSADVLEQVQPKGPRGVELVLRGTPAAAALVVRRPDLQPKERRGLLVAGQQPAMSISSEGWTLRLT